MNRMFRLFVVVFFYCLTVVGQERIVKLNGDTIHAKILEVGTNAISYKKASLPDGPTFVDLKSDIFLVIFSNGEVTYITKKTEPVKTQSQSGNRNEPDTIVNNVSNAQTVKNKIEVQDGSYLINGDYASQKEVNRLLAQSKNPMISIPLKAAKATSTAQKIIKVLSYPTTIGGGIGTLVTGINYINDVRRGRDNTKTYVSLFSSMLTTISLPITNKILKSKSDKMYNQLIDVYNVTN